MKGVFAHVLTTVLSPMTTTLPLSITIIPNRQPNVKFYSAINLLIGKGIEPHPTDGYHSVSFLTTLRLMERPLSLTQPCREEWGGSQLLPPLSTYIISNLISNVKFFYGVGCGSCFTGDHDSHTDLNRITPTPILIPTNLLVR